MWLVVIRQRSSRNGTPRVVFHALTTLSKKLWSFYFFFFILHNLILSTFNLDWKAYLKSLF